MKKRSFSLMELSLLGVLALMFIIFSILNGPAFYQSYNLLNIFKSAGSMALMVLGLTWVIGCSTNAMIPPCVWWSAFSVAWYSGF